MGDLDGAEYIEPTVTRTGTYSTDERKTRAVKRIEDRGFDVSTLFTPWDTTASLGELGSSSLSAVEEILKILLYRNCSREEIFIQLDGAVNGAVDSRTSEPCKPTFAPLRNLRRQLRDGSSVQPISSRSTRGITRQASSSEKPKRKPRKSLSQSSAKRVCKGLAHSLRNDTEEVYIHRSQHSSESTSSHDGDHPENSDYYAFIDQASSKLLTHTRSSQRSHERSSQQPRIESSDDDIAANDTADSQLFPTSAVSNTNTAIHRSKQRNTQGDPIAGRTAESSFIKSRNRLSLKNWRTRLEPCTADAQGEYDGVAAVYETAKNAYATTLKSEDDALKSLSSFRTAGTPLSRLSVEAIESGTVGPLLQRLEEIDAIEKEDDQLRSAYQQKKESRIAQAKILVKSKSDMEKKVNLLKQLQNIMDDLITDSEPEAE